MQARLFRFEILRSLAPAAFEARDPGTGSLVTLYEWTPAPADRDAARQRLAALAEQLPAEVFTADASLYLAAASPAFAREALEVLRKQHLFTGTDNDYAPAIPTPAPMPPPAMPVPATPAAPRRMPALLLTGVFAVGLGYLLAKATETTPACPVPVVDNTSAAALANESTHRQQLEAQLASERDASSARSEALAAVDGVHLLRIKNGCGSPVRAAVLYTGFNHARLAQGWMTLAPGETATIAASPSLDFDVFATTAGGDQSWGSDESNSIDTLPTDFVYSVSAGFEQPDKVPHPTFRVHVNANTEVSALNCSASARAE